MRNISIFLILIFSAFGTACDNEIIENAADFEFETVDKKSNKINFLVMGKGMTLHHKESFDDLLNQLQIPLVIIP